MRGGLDRVIDLARANQLEARYLWVACKGAWKYARAVATGDAATNADQAARVRVCVACSATERVPTSREGLVSAYCGRGNRTEDGPTCGCLVFITIGGVASAAGKTKVASEACPRHKWKQAERRLPGEDE
jgi:hypothetical protein